MKGKRSKLLALLLVLVLVLSFGLMACKPKKQTPENPQEPYVPEAPAEDLPTDEDADDDLIGDALGDLGIKDPGWVYDKEAGTLYADGGNKRAYYRVQPALEYIFSTDVTFGGMKADPWPKAGIVGAQGKMYSENAMLNYPANGNALTLYGGSGTNVDMFTGQNYYFDGNSDTLRLEIVRRGGNFYYFVNGRFIAYKYNSYFDSNLACPGFQMWGGQTTYSNMSYSTNADEITAKINSATAKFEIKPSEGGTVEVKSESGGTVAIGATAYVSFKPNDGYRLSALKVAEKSVLYKLGLAGSTTNYVIDSAAASSVIEAEFEPIPTEKYTVSGKIRLENNSKQSIIATAYSGSFVKDIVLTYNEGDSCYDYSVELPAGENYNFEVRSSGFVTANATLDVFGAVSKDYTLKKLPFGSSPQMDIWGNWITDSFGKGEVSIQAGYSRLPVTELNGQDKFFLSADVHILDPQDRNARAGLLFGNPKVYTEGEKAGQEYNEELEPTVHFTGGRYTAHILGAYGLFGVDDRRNLTAAETAKALDDSVGINLALYRDGANAKVFVDGVLYKEYSGLDTTCDWTVGFAAWTKAKFSDIKWAVGDAADTLAANQRVLKLTELSNNGTSTVVTEPVLGNPYSVSLEAKTGYYISEVIINGVDRFKDYGGKTSVLITETATSENYDIKVAYDRLSDDIYTLSGSVSLHAKGETEKGEGVTVKVYGGDSIQTCSTDADGNFSIDLADRKYFVEIVKDGFVTQSLIVDIDRDEEIAVTLEYDILAMYEGYGDLTNQNENEIRLDGYSFGYFSEVAENEKYFVAYATVYFEGATNPNDYRVGIAFNRHLQNTANEASLTLCNDGFAKIVGTDWSRTELKQAHLDKFKSSSGVQLMIIRYNTTVFMLVDGELYYTATIAESVPSNVGLVTWYDTKFTDYGVITGKTSLDELSAVSFNGSNAYGSWTGNGTFGSHGQIVFAPNSGYEIESVTLNGEDVTAQVINKRLDIDCVTLLNNTVEVEFREIAQITETASLSGTAELFRNNTTFRGEVEVTLSTANGENTLTSGADGSFAFNDVAAMQYYLRIEREGYEPYITSVDLSNGDIELDTTIVLYYDLFKNATVGIGAANANEGTVTTVGGYSLNELATPESKNFYLEATVKFTRVPNGNARLGLAVNKDDTAAGITSFRPTVYITGDGTSVTGVRLEVMGGLFVRNLDAADFGKATSGIRIALARVNTAILVYYDGELCYSGTIAADAPSAAALEQWAVGEYNNLVYYNDGTVYSNDTSTVSGTLSLASGDEITGATVAMYDLSDGLIATATVDASGAYSFAGVRSYRKAVIVAEKSGYAPKSNIITVENATHDFVLNTIEYAYAYCMTATDGGETVTATPTQRDCPYITFATFPATENFLLTAVLKQDLTANNYGENYAGLGFDILTAGGKHYEFLYRRVNNDTVFDLKGYSDNNAVYRNLTAAEITALTGGSGLMMRIARGDGKIMLFVGNEEFASAEIAIGNDAITSFKLKSWTATGTYNDITLVTGDAAIASNAPANGEIIAPTAARVGETVTVEFAPDTAYYLSSVKLNGAEVLSKIEDLRLSFVVSKTAYTIEATYTYEGTTPYTYEGVVKVKNGVDAEFTAAAGATVTLASKDGTVRETATTAADGSFAFEVMMREYTLTVTKDGYESYTAEFTLDENISGVEIKLNSTAIVSGVAGIMKRTDGGYGVEITANMANNDHIGSKINPALTTGNFSLSLDIASNNLRGASNNTPGIGLAVFSYGSSNNKFEILFRRMSADTAYNLHSYTGLNRTLAELSADQVTKLTTDGLNLRIVNVDSTIYIFFDGAKTPIAQYTLTGDIKEVYLYTWGLGGSYNNIKVETNAQISGDQPAAGATWQVTGGATIGSTATLDIEVEQNYYLSSVKINGVEKIGDLALDNTLEFLVLNASNDIEVIAVYEDPTTYTVSGVVTSNKLGETDAPLAGAKVTLVSKDGRISEELTTAADGAFEFTVKTREYTLTVTKDGYITYTATVNLTENKTNDLALEWNSLTVKSGTNWDISKQNDGEITFNGSQTQSYGFVRFNDIAESEQYFVASAVFKHQGYRMGISVNREDEANTEYGATLNEAGNYSSAGQAGWGAIATISDLNKAAAQGSGLRITMVRNATELYYFAGDVLVKKWTIDASVLSRVSIVEWTQKTSTTKGITYAVGETAVTEYLAARAKFAYAGTASAVAADYTRTPAEGVTVTLTGKLGSGNYTATSAANGSFAIEGGVLGGIYTVTTTYNGKTYSYGDVEINAANSALALDAAMLGVTDVPGYIKFSDGNRTATVGLTGNVTEKSAKIVDVPASDSFIFTTKIKMDITTNRENTPALGIVIMTNATSGNKFEFVLRREGSNEKVIARNYSGYTCSNNLEFNTANGLITKLTTEGIDVKIIRSGETLSVYVDGSTTAYATASIGAAQIDGLHLGVWNVNGQFKNINVFTGDATVTGETTVTGGSWQASNLAVGGTATIDIEPAADYRLKALIVDGTDVTASVVDNAYSFKVIKQAYAVSVEFEEIPEQYWAYAGTVSGYDVDGTVIDLSGATVTLTSADNTYTTTSGADGSFSFDSVLEGTYTLSATKKDNATFTESVSITADIADKAITVNANDFTYTDTNAQGLCTVSDGGRTVTVQFGTVQHHGIGAIVSTVPATGDFVLSTNIKIDKTTTLITGAAMGIEVKTGNTKFQSIFRRDNAENTLYKARKYDGYTLSNGEYSITGSELTALIDGDGIEMRVVRSGGMLYVYILGHETPYAHASLDQNASIILTLATWCFSGTYSNIEVYTGNATISASSEANGEISAPATAAIGSTVTATLTPETGYRVKSVFVNNVDMVGSVQDNKLSFVAAKKSYNIVAEFEEIPVTYSYSGVVKGHRNGEQFILGGATVTLDSDHEDYTVTAAEDGTFTFDAALADEYSVVVSKSGYLTSTTPLTLNANESGDEIVVEYDLIAATSGFGLANQNAGTVTWAGGYGLPKIKAIPDSSRYWVVDTVIKSTNTAAGNRFGGLAIGKNDNMEGVSSFRFNLYLSSATEIKICMQGGDSYALSADQFTAATTAGGAGVRLTMARANDRIFIYVDGVQKMVKYIAPNYGGAVTLESWQACTYNDLRVYTDGDAATYLSTLATVSGTISEITAGSVEGTVVTAKKMDGTVIATKTLGAGETTYSFDNIPTGNFVRITAEKAGYIIEGRIVKITADTTVDLTIAKLRYTKAGSYYTVSDGGSTVAYNSTAGNNDKYWIETKSNNWTLTTFVTFDRTKCWSTESNGGTEGYPGFGFALTGDMGTTVKIESCIRYTVSADKYEFCAYSGLNGGSVEVTGDNRTALTSETGLKITVKCVNGTVSFYAGDSTTAYHTATTAISRMTGFSIMNWNAGGTFRNITLTSN